MSSLHFQFQFKREGVIGMRFLSCLCDHCKVKEWEKCVNKARVGEWCEVEIQERTAKGVAAQKGKRNARASTVSGSLKEGDVVAVFTHVDLHDHRFWLAKVAELPSVCRAPMACPVSKVEFSVDEAVLKVHWYDRIGMKSTEFAFKPDLGLFTIPVSMLRAGGADLPLALDVQPARTRHGTDIHVLSDELNSEILQRMNHIFKDKEYEE